MATWDKKGRAYTMALTERMINNSLRAIERDHGIAVQASDAKQLLALHTDIMSHLRLFTDFNGSRLAMLRAHLAEVLKQCRDILITSGTEWETLADKKLTKADLVDAMDIVLGTSLLVVGMLNKAGTNDPALDQIVSALPLRECGPFAQDALRQLR
jgi:hypothetical protein